MTAVRFDEPPAEGEGRARRLGPLRDVASMISVNGWLTLAAAVVLAVLALVSGYGELAVIAGALLVAWLVAVAVALRPSSIVAQRFIVPARVKEGEKAQGLLTISNTGRVRAPPAVATEAFDGRDFPIPLPSIPAHSEHVCSYTVSTSRRGRHRVGPLRISRADPFGFVRAATAGGPIAQLVVHPQVFDVPPLQSGRVRDLEGAQQSRRAQGGVAFHHLREYVPGDDRRLIHWRSSAKTDKLLVRHNVVTHEPSLSVVLDTSAVYSDADAFEDAVRVAASLVVAGVNGGFPTSLHTTSGYGGTVELNGDGLVRVLDLLAAVRTGSDDPGLAYLAGLYGSGRAETSLGVVTGLPGPHLLGRISRVASRFDTVSTILVGDRLDRAAPAISGSFVMRAPTAADWARMWKSRFG